jgi:hypothetical protein
MLFLVLELHVLLMRWTGPMALFNQHRAAQGDLQWWKGDICSEVEWSKDGRCQHLAYAQK